MAWHIPRRRFLTSILMGLTLSLGATSWDLNFVSNALPFDEDLWGPDLHQIPVQVEPRVLAFEKLFLESRRSWLDACLERSWDYRAYILQVLEEQGVPLELEYLPIIESSFVASALSHAGASGLWQFMTNSMGYYNMRVDSWVDERKDFIKSTLGAVKKLKSNFQVTGDWNLALAAYNAGLGRINGIIKKTGKRDYWTLSVDGKLPRETAAYVPQFIAVTRLLSRKARNKLSVVWDDPKNWKTIKLTRAIDLKILAQHSGVPLQELTFGNRELKHSITPEMASGYLLKVPGQYLATLEATLANNKIPLLSYHLYRIKSGDTLSELAWHYGISIDMIEKHNGALNPRALRIGKELLIPALKDVGPYPGRKKATPPKPAVAATKLSPGGNYLVKSGDTLWSLSRNHDLTVEELAKINGISTQGVLRIGQSLSIPGYKGGPQ